MGLLVVDLLVLGLVSLSAAVFPGDSSFFTDLGDSLGCLAGVDLFCLGVVALAAVFLAFVTLGEGVGFSFFTIIGFFFDV